jgi:hypothetical protein
MRWEDEITCWHQFVPIIQHDELSVMNLPPASDCLHLYERQPLIKSPLTGRDCALGERLEGHDDVPYRIDIHRGKTMEPSGRPLPWRGDGIKGGLIGGFQG